MFTVSGVETFSQEVNDFAKGVQDKIPAALRIIGANMIKSLQKHIETDVYGAYEPISYPRRFLFPQFGTSIHDEKNMDVSVAGNMLIFAYTPTGAHTGLMKDTLNWDGDSASFSGNEPLKPHPANGDELIAIIETGTGYDWDCDVPSRPFWTNFAEEQKSDQIMLHFIAGMSPYKVEKNGEDVLFDGSEYVDSTIIKLPF